VVVLPEVPLALRSLSRLLLDMVLPTCSRASWLAVLLQAAQVLRRHPKSSKASLVCQVTCRLLAHRDSTRLRLLLTTHSHMAVNLKDPVSMATALSHPSLPLHLVQVSLMLAPAAVLTAVLMVALMDWQRLSRASPAHTLVHPMWHVLRRLLLTALPRRRAACTMVSHTPQLSLMKSETSSPVSTLRSSHLR
jgi:hypothetical protein